MKSEKIWWLILELRLLTNEYTYLNTVSVSYDPKNLYYIVRFDCDFCGEFISIRVAVMDGLSVDMNLCKEIEKVFASHYLAYEKYFT